MTHPNVNHERLNLRGSFFMQRNGERVALMTYAVAGSRLIIDHTEVDSSLRGTGAGHELVRAAVAWARDHDVRLTPVCPFARAVFDKTPEFSDVRAD